MTCPDPLTENVSRRSRCLHFGFTPPTPLLEVRGEAHPSLSYQVDRFAGIPHAVPHGAPHRLLRTDGAIWYPTRTPMRRDVLHGNRFDRPYPRPRLTMLATSGDDDPATRSSDRR